MSKTSCRQELLMKKLNEFYADANNINILLPIVMGTSNISLRVIDWFVTNYSKKNNIFYNIDYEQNDEIKTKQFIVYINYKSQLKAYSKKYFDPFCRRERIEFTYNTNKNITTTVGQLNFFRWGISNGIIDYIRENLSLIEKDMNQSIRHLYQKKEQNNDIDSKRRKRHQLSISATRSVTKHHVSLIVDFGLNKKV